MSSQSLNDGSIFSGKVRIRVSGLLFEDEKVLLLKHNTIGPEGYLWSPPGGGVEFGQTMEEALKQEFLEETNLVISVTNYLFTNEFIGKDHHAIELFFEVEKISGNPVLGNDPELSEQDQILTELKFFSLSELRQLPKTAVHNAFHAIDKMDKMVQLKGLVTFKHL